MMMKALIVVGFLIMLFWIRAVRCITQILLVEEEPSFLVYVYLNFKLTGLAAKLYYFKLWNIVLFPFTVASLGVEFQSVVECVF